MTKKPVAKLRANRVWNTEAPDGAAMIRVWSVAIILPLALLSGGCATSVDTAPFQNFSQTLRYTGNTMEKVMRAAASLHGDEFVRDFSARADSRLPELKIKTTGPFSWEMLDGDPPLFVRINQSRIALLRLNEALNSYSILLLELADGKLLAPTAFSQFEKSLNRSAASAFRTLAPEQPASSPAILSQTAGDLMRHYLESKRRRYLAQAIRENQYGIELYSQLARELALKCRNDIKRYYTNETARLFEQWATATKNDKQKEREKLAKSMIELNMQLINTLDLLEALDAAYAALPAANSDLATAIMQPGALLPGIEQLQQASSLIKALQQ